MDELLGADAPVIVVLGALVLLAAAIKTVGIPAWRFLRRVGHFLDDYFGEPPRPGAPGRPGVTERLAHVEATVTAVQKELHPNGGSSLRDAVDRVDQKLTDHLAEADTIRSTVEGAIGDLDAKIDEHITEATADRAALHVAVDALITEAQAHHDGEGA